MSQSRCCAKEMGWTERSGLRAIEGYLREADHIGLMHNEDDILLAESDLDFLRDTFGERALIYPRGGHSELTRRDS